MTASQKCAIMMGHLRRHGEIGRHKGLKIPRRKKRTGSSPVAGTNEKAPQPGCFFVGKGIGLEPILMGQGVFCKGRFYPLRKIHMTAAHLW